MNNEQYEKSKVKSQNPLTGALLPFLLNVQVCDATADAMKYFPRLQKIFFFRSNVLAKHKSS